MTTTGNWAGADVCLIESTCDDDCLIICLQCAMRRFVLQSVRKPACSLACRVTQENCSPSFVLIFLQPLLEWPRKPMLRLPNTSPCPVAACSLKWVCHQRRPAILRRPAKAAFSKLLTVGHHSQQVLTVSVSAFFSRARKVKWSRIYRLSLHIGAALSPAPLLKHHPRHVLPPSRHGQEHQDVHVQIVRPATRGRQKTRVIPS